MKFFLFMVRYDILISFCRGEIVGRQVLPVRICTCPKRDMETEEKHESKSASSATSALTQAGHGKKKIEKGSKEEYWVLARGKDNFEALKKVGEVLEKGSGGNVTHYNDDVTVFNRNLKRKREAEAAEQDHNGLKH